MEDQPACCRPTQNRSTTLRKGGPQRAMPLRLGKEIQAMLRPQLTTPQSIAEKGALHLQGSISKIVADPIGRGVRARNRSRTFARSGSRPPGPDLGQLARCNAIQLGSAWW